MGRKSHEWYGSFSRAIRDTEQIYRSVSFQEMGVDAKLFVADHLHIPVMTMAS